MTSAVKTGSKPLNIAVVGTGISGMSAAWLLSQRHKVTVYEAADRIGGHTNTVDAPAAAGGTTPVDTGFIVYNELNYPNLVALFAHLGVETRGSDMSFAVSLDGGALEYGSTDLKALFAQKRNILRPRFWSMLRDLQRFYKTAPHTVDHTDQFTTLGDYLSRHGYGVAFQNDHLLPQASAIWSSDIKSIRDYPIASFVRFFKNHGLLEIDINARPQWRTVVGGSRSYIPHLTASYADRIRLGTKVRAIARSGEGVTIQDGHGATTRYDHVVIAAHAPQALAMLMEPTAAEHQVLGAIRYTPNTAVLHTDTDLMPRRRAAWSAWNYVGASGGKGEVTYWMNRLQGLNGPEHFFVSLNPPPPSEKGAPKPECVIATEHYEHPLFDVAAGVAQRRLWSLQGVRNTWFCGAYFGAGFHEDGLQSGLAVAEALGGVRRPWHVENESGRIFIDQDEAKAA
jgi:predicted NAD/FAD-binding protein